ncbi:MAG: phosphoribosyl-AMP cyclohydrolase [Omnitrophica bacterium]|nr:phosphoribosyl-AMP cyclohydrolase [Candidatus Omnitrophota bacterium]
MRKNVKLKKEGKTPLRLPQLKFNKDGLIPTIVQDKKTGAVLMVAYMSKESLKITLREKRTCFYSRSRRELWRKGQTSGHIQKVKEIRYDCDKDALLIKVEQVGAACHTGERSCFYRRIT